MNCLTIPRAGVGSSTQVGRLISDMRCIRHPSWFISSMKSLRKSLPLSDPSSFSIRKCRRRSTAWARVPATSACRGSTILFHPNDEHALRLLQDYDEVTCDITKWGWEWNADGRPVCKAEERSRHHAVRRRKRRPTRRQFPNVTGVYCDDLLGLMKQLQVRSAGVRQRPRRHPQRESQPEAVERRLHPRARTGGFLDRDAAAHGRGHALDLEVGEHRPHGRRTSSGAASCFPTSRS